MKKYIRALCAASAVSVLWLAGCSVSAAQESTADANPAKESENGGSAAAETETAAKTEENEKGSVPVNGSDFFLLSQVPQNGDGNKMISKVSLDAVLNILALGTSDENMRKTLLDYTGLDASADLTGQLRALAAAEDPETVLTANGIWVDEQFGLKNEFRSDVDGLGVEVSGFSDPSAAMKEINSFVDDNTRQMIHEIISDPADIRDMVLINTLYFDGKWEEPFDSASTWEETFTSKDGKETGVDFMHTEGGSYYADEDWEAWSYPYRGDTYEFVAVLPADETKLSFDYADLDLETLLAAKSDSRVDVSLPKFKFDWDSSLDEVLRASGLAGIYSGGAFDRMMTLPANVSSVFQKTRVELDEDGTKAAAVTEIMLQATALLEEDPPKEIRFDRPFLFVIRNVKTGAHLFTGLVNLPAEQ